MAKAFRTTIIDKDKFDAWVKKVMKENHIKNVNEFADKIGYNHTFVYNTMARGTLSIPAIKVMESVYGLDVNDIMPDEPKPEIKAEPEKAPEPVKEAVDLSALEDTLKREFLTLMEIKGFMDDVRRGFRVQTLPRLDSESIAEGVYDGISRFWERNKKDFISQLRGIVFAGTFEAGKKLDEVGASQKNSNIR